MRNKRKSPNIRTSLQGFHTAHPCGSLKGVLLGKVVFFNEIGSSAGLELQHEQREREHLEQ